MGDHFEGKDAAHHLIDARRKGAAITAEVHGQELSGLLFALADSAKESALYLLLLFVLFGENWPLLLIFSGVLFFWKVGRSSLLGYSRLERLHRLIEEERWEITHHRAQEREELREMYEVKGFKGELLDKVVEVLMADDNRLLKVMLEEELGLTLESFEHPLRQGFGAGLGALCGIVITLLGAYFFHLPGVMVGAGIVIALAAGRSAHAQKNDRVKAIVWSLSLAFSTMGIAYFLKRLFG